MITPSIILERVTHVTPFGVQLWDAAVGQAVGSDLTVTAYPANNPVLRVSATPNRVGVYMLYNLPGLSEFESGTGEAEFWAQAAQQPKSFIVEVVDDERRYQPFRFDAPLPARGLFSLGCLSVASPLGSPPAALPTRVPLYPALTYPPPAGMAVLRMQLRHISRKPAAWAVLEVYWQNQLLGRSFADQQGRIAIIFPYPKLPDPEFASPPAAPLTSPPLGRRPALSEQTWLLQLRAFYTPASIASESQEFNVSGETYVRLANGAFLNRNLPDLCAVFQQTPATLLSELSPAEPLPDVRLKFGQELIVRSRSQSEVWVA